MNNQDIINEVRRRNDIVDVIGEKIPLEKRGKNYFGVCPFHDDTNPSMSVSREKQIYTCFSCHATGNVFTFLMNYEHKEFNEVLSELASRVGITLTGFKVKKASTKYDEWYKIYNIANKYYQNNLLTKEGEGAREYLKNRSIDDNTVKEFEIGYSLNMRDDLTKLLTAKGHSIDLLNKIGLSNEDHDIYNSRLMFPLHDLNGKVIGFSGRIITGGKQNKYLNTKETELFKKGKLLYHYHIAREEARVKKSVIIMEGFMDIIRASTVGIKNTVATMGTALTRDHIKEIKRLSNNIILCFDGDEAGVKATIASGELFKREGIEVKVISLPGEDDPDTYILKNGKDAFLSLINNAIYYSDFKIKNLSRNRNFASSEEKANYIHEVLEEASKINDTIRTEIILKDLAKKFEIGYNTLEKSFMELVNNKEIKKEVITTPKTTQPKKKDKYQKASLNIIYYMLNKQDIIDKVESEHLVLPTEALRALESEIVYFYHKYGFINEADFYTYLAPKGELLNLLNEVLEMDLKTTLTNEELNDYFKVIREYNYKKTISNLEEKIRNEIDPLMQVKYAEEIRKLRIGES
ncbi:MAG TPA: DNA primase [Candidatus Onthousia faecipullorum]|uniref:DNA primase n=1 Tax=Candidatus Onthousia faecipullorum TaxID=2840887 RepID=A0A9D1GD33_9FIRM|nr:DNA primase [Candidatus Onthousia faecipullorum]